MTAPSQTSEPKPDQLCRYRDLHGKDQTGWVLTPPLRLAQIDEPAKELVLVDINEQMARVQGDHESQDTFYDYLGNFADIELADSEALDPEQRYCLCLRDDGSMTTLIDQIKARLNPDQPQHSRRLTVRLDLVSFAEGNLREQTRQD